MVVDIFNSMDRGRRSRRAGAAVLAAAMATLSGCGRSDSLPSYQVYEVKGQVLLADGKPLGGGLITFVPKGDMPVSPSGVIGSDGSFALSTGGSGDGAPAGDYKVRVEAPQFQQAAPKARKKPIFPQKYNDEDSSGLVITVRAQSNQLEPIRLK
jgi:hypothetical protein